MTMEKAGKRHARRIAMALLMVAAGLVSPANAEKRPTYDKRIEEAAIRMLIPKLGEMRGSLDLGANVDILPMARERVIENRAAEVPAPVPGHESKGSLLFF
ncbi:hypothetical protein [Hoeflea sp.]|uniref:hypothetical protein n=1 Tax=Hoeflea sp. TaxID=1940281 RepID=UPI003A8EAC26